MATVGAGVGLVGFNVGGADGELGFGLGPAVGAGEGAAANTVVNTNSHKRPTSHNIIPANKSPNSTSPDPFLSTAGTCVCARVLAGGLGLEAPPGD